MEVSTTAAVRPTLSPTLDVVICNVIRQTKPGYKKSRLFQIQYCAILRLLMIQCNYGKVTNEHSIILLVILLTA